MKTLLCLLLIDLVAYGQQAAGKVVNSISGAPIRKAMVILRAQGGGDKAPSYAVETDSHGQFTIAEIAPGSYIITADRAGFQFQTRGARGAPPAPTVFERGQQINDLVLKLIPAGVIAGRVLDDEGDPVRGAQVMAMTTFYTGEKKELRRVDQVTSNDAGEYRLFGLTPGTFYLQVSPINNMRSYGGPPPDPIRGSHAPEKTAPTYFPSASDAALAVPIEVAPGAELRGFDIRLRRERLYSARVKLPSMAGPEHYYHGNVAGAGKLNLRPQFHFNGDIFEFQGLQPGSYTLTITQMEGDKQSYARVPVVIVNADVDGGTAAFAPAMDVTGTLRADDSKPHPWENIQVSLTSEAGNSYGATTTAGADGSFVMRNVPPDTYHLAVRQNSPVPDTYVKSARIGDRDLVDWQLDLSKENGPLSILLGTDVGQIEGSVQNASGEPVSRARVNLFPYDNSTGRTDQTKLTFTDEKGEFNFKSVAPAQYRIFAWEDVELGRPQDPAFRKRFEKQSVLVKVEPKGHQKVQVTAVTAAAAKSPNLQ